MPEQISEVTSWANDFVLFGLVYVAYRVLKFFVDFVQFMTHAR